MDFISKRLHLLKNHRIANLDFGENSIFPNYNGNSILNIPSSICHAFGIPPLSSVPLDSELLTTFTDAPQHIFFILVDGLAFHRFQQWIEEGAPLVWKSLIADGMFAPITSVLPSTTTSALTSLWSGLPPISHGIVGYELWLKEYGMVTNMVTQTPMSFRINGASSPELSITRAGFKPKEYLAQPTFGSHLLSHGIQPYAFQHYSIVSSGLSQMLLNDVPFSSFGMAAELWVNCRQWLENQKNKRTCAWVYWGEIDHLAHQFGADDERVRAEFSMFSYAFQSFFLERLSPALRKNTLIILTADHGQINTSKNSYNELKNHPQLDSLLAIKPTGENRVVYCFVRPGNVKMVIDMVENTWKNGFTIMESKDFMKSGLLGNGDPHPMLRDRLGDIVLLARDENYLWWGNKENPLLGRHGGMHPHEMLVPLVISKLG